jgi:hypothetical protein
VLPYDIEQLPRFVFPEGRYFVGYGKYFSRFLHLFSEDLRVDIYNTNNRISVDIAAEICGDDNFNANLHPPLLEYEISYPTGEGGLAKKQLDCTNIIVEADAHDPYLLRLKDKVSKRFINPLDLGFQNSMMRPPLFQLLANFTSPANFSLNIPSSFELNGKESPRNTIEGKDNTRKGNSNVPKVVYRPRIVLEGDIILSRKTWFVPGELFPSISDKEEDAEYFIRINKWRIENKIPSEVYVKIIIISHYLPQNINTTKNKMDKSPEQRNIKNMAGIDDLSKEDAVYESAKSITGENNAQTINTKRKQKMSRDYNKPQYIDFNSPLLVNLLGKISVNLKHFKVIIEERYPQTKGLLSVNDDCYASEQIFQINYPKESFLSKEVTNQEYHE